MDIEDGHKLRIISTDETIALLMRFFEPDRAAHVSNVMATVADPNEKIVYLRSCIVGLLVDECARVFVENEDAILRGEFSGTLIEHMSEVPADGYRACSDLAYHRLYRAGYVVDVDLAGNRIINFLLDKLIDAVLHPEHNYSQLLLNKFPEQYDVSASSLYEKIQAVIDHISAMTDVYALNLYRQLGGISLPTV